MSDLGAIFHVKKNGTQYDAHAYTTLAECPYPNLKIKTKSGTQAYVKLTTNGQGDVPFRVKPKSDINTPYQVLAEAYPTGSFNIIGTTYFTTPKLVKRLKIIAISTTGNSYTRYVEVSPQTTYLFRIENHSDLYTEEPTVSILYIVDHYDDSKINIYPKFKKATAYWSPAINAGIE